MRNIRYHNTIGNRPTITISRMARGGKGMCFLLRYAMSQVAIISMSRVGILSTSELRSWHPMLRKASIILALRSCKLKTFHLNYSCIYLHELLEAHTQLLRDQNDSSTEKFRIFYRATYNKGKTS